MGKVWSDYGWVDSETGQPWVEPTKSAASAPAAPARTWTAAEKAEAVKNATANGNVLIIDPVTGAPNERPMTSAEQLTQNQFEKDHPTWGAEPGAEPAPEENTAPVVDNALVNQALDNLETPVTNPALATRPPVQQRSAFGDNPMPTRPARAVKAQPAPGTVITNGMSTGGITRDELAARYGENAGQSGPGSEAGDVDRTKIDAILGGLSGYEQDIADLGSDNTGLSVAEAQLKKATDLANLQAGIDTEASARAALGQARSGRSRGDRALLERQAVGEASFIGQEAARTGALRRAQNEGDLAELRAQEADYDRRFRLEALGKAADLGLNRAALEVDISKTNLDSATNWVNQQFNQLGIDKQINQEQAQMLLGYTRDMAAIQLQYDQLSQQEQIEADKLLMQRYDIDQDTMVAMKQIKEQGKFKWDQVLAGVAGGVGSAGTTAIAKVAGIG